MTMPLRSLDHLVLATVSTTVARTRLTALGFTVAADARHPFGTENACVFFADKTYIEPLAVTDAATCMASARAGNVFVARHQAFRFRCGEGLSAIVLATGDADDDHQRFREAGISAGDMLSFSRPMKLPDGSEAVGSFKLAFAADLRAPDFFAFNCQRVQSLPSDRAALEKHANGVTAMAGIVLAECHPADFSNFLAEILGVSAAATAGVLEYRIANAIISVADREGLDDGFASAVDPSRGLRGRAILFTVADLKATEALLLSSGIDYMRRHNRLVVPPAPGQGAIFAFGE